MPVTIGSLSDHYIFEERGIDLRPGHFARVFAATSINQGCTAAFKVLRPEHLKRPLASEYSAFAREARLLTRFRQADAPEVVRILECGYVEDHSERPDNGDIAAFGLDAEAFAAEMPAYYKRRWRPYIYEEQLPEEHNLYARLQEYNKAGQRRRLPTEEALALAVQYVDLLCRAHRDGIVYLDAKLDHFYWDGAQLRLIDWNASRDLKGESVDPDDADQLKRTDIHAFVVGLFYSVLTGLPPDRQRMFEPMPNNVGQVEERYRDTEDLDFACEPTLGPIVNLCRAAAGWKYASIEQFAADLRACAREYGWDFGNSAHPTAAASEARERIRAGLAALRRAQADVETARQMFMAAQDCAGHAYDARRLHDRTLEFWHHRVIP